MKSRTGLSDFYPVDILDKKMELSTTYSHYVDKDLCKSWIIFFLTEISQVYIMDAVFSHFPGKNLEKKEVNALCG